LLCSARDATDLVYRDELMRMATSDEIDISVTYTRTRPPGWNGYGRRIDREMLVESGWPPGADPLVYVCGPTAFVETAADLLVGIGHDPARIRTERFGGIGENP
jgi:ferredoxin-NADP reductase